jgi:hypothetical protein
VSCEPLAQNAHVLFKIDRAVGKRLFGVNALNEQSDETAAEVAVGRLSGHIEAPHTPAANALYLLSAAALFKPQAMENLLVNLSSCN